MPRPLPSVKNNDASPPSMVADRTSPFQVPWPPSICGAEPLVVAGTGAPVSTSSPVATHQTFASLAKVWGFSGSLKADGMGVTAPVAGWDRPEEHTAEQQTLMRSA